MAVALVTGAAGGLGRAVARRLSADGHLVAGTDLPGKLAGETAEGAAAGAPTADGGPGGGRPGGGGPVGGEIVVPADISDPDQVERLVGEVEDQAGEQIGILVANAAYMSMAPLTEHDLDDWWRIVDTALGGAFACAQAVLPGMSERGGGRMVMIASEWGVTGWPNASAYSAAKAGIIALTKSLGRELGPLGIAVNAIAPSVIDTSQLEVDARDAGVPVEEIRARYAERVPLGRIASAEEIAAAVSFLADDRLPTLVGQILHVNGGTTRTRI